MLIDSATAISGESLDQGAPINLSTPMSESGAVVSMSPTNIVVVDSPLIEAISINGDAMFDTPVPSHPSAV
jgi:hypothetical protein